MNKRFSILIILAMVFSLFTFSSMAFADEAFYDVTDYGAIPNDTLDDADAIQAAFNAARANGGTVYFPYGTFLIDSNINVQGNGVNIQPLPGSDLHFTKYPTLKVEGDQATIKATTSNVTRMFDVKGNAFYFVIEGLKFDGNNVAQVGVYSDWNMHGTIQRNAFWKLDKGVAMEGYGVVNINNNVFKCDYGIWMEDSDSSDGISGGGGDSILSHNDFYPGIAGIHMGEWSGNTAIFRNIFSRDGQSNIKGIELRTENSSMEVRDIIITQNEFCGMETSIYARGTSSARNVYDIIVADNHAKTMAETEGGSVGVDWKFIDAQYCQGWQIHNNFIGAKNPGTAWDCLMGMWIADCERFQINNNEFGMMESVAMELARTKDFKIMGNRFYNAGTRSLGDPFVALWDVTDSTVQDNWFQNDDGQIDNWAGFAVAVKNNSNNNRVTNNFTKNVNGGVFNYTLAGNKNVIMDHISGASYPTSGYHTRGTICWNSEPSSGEPMGWTMIANDDGYGGSWNNTSAQWKPFGTIN